MKEIVWIFVNGILFAAATNTTISELENTTNSEKFALETILGFKNTNNTENIQFLDKVQKVIGKMKTVIENNSNKRRNLSGLKHVKFTDFIQDLIKKLNQFDDKDLEVFLNVFSVEVRKYHYQGCKFHELTENYAFRTFFSSLLHEIKIQPLNKIKSILLTVANKIENEEYNSNERELVDIINSFYRQNSLEKLQQFLINIEAYKMKTRKNLDIVKIVREGLRSIIFDHYTSLNRNARKELKVHINEYFNNLSGQSTTKNMDKIKYSIAQEPAHTTKKPTTLKEVDKYINKDLKYNQSVDARSDLKQYTKRSSNLRHTPLIIRKLDKIESIKSKNNGHLRNHNEDTSKVIRSREFIHDKKPERPNDSFNRTTYSTHRTITPLRTTQSLDTRENLHMRYETDAFEYLISEPKRKKLTFRTLYPKFVTELTEPLVARRQMYHKTTVGKPEYSWEEDEINNSVQKTRRDRAIHLVKVLGATVKIGMKTSRRIDTKFQKLKTTVGKPEYSWEEDDINIQISIQKPRHVKRASKVKELGPTGKVGRKGMHSNPMQRINTKGKKSKHQVPIKNLREPSISSIAQVTPLERSTRLRTQLPKSYRTRKSNRRNYGNSMDALQRQKADLTDRKFKIYNERNEINNTFNSNSSPNKTNDLINVKVPAIRKTVKLQISDSHKKKNDEKAEDLTLVYDEKPKNSNKENLEDLPKKDQFGERMKSYNDLNEMKTSKINKQTVNITSDEINNDKELDSALNAQRIQTLKPQPKESKFKNERGEYNHINRSSTKPGSISIKENSNNFGLNREEMDTSNFEKDVDSKYENNDQQVPNYDENDEEKDPQPWVPQPDDDFKKDIEDYQNDFKGNENIEQKSKNEIVFRSLNSSPKTINENKVTNTENIRAITTNLTTTVSSKPMARLTTAEITISNNNFADVAPFAYAENNMFEDLDKLIAKQTTIRQSKIKTQQMMKNFVIEDSMEKLRGEIANSAQVNFGKDMHDDTDKENVMVDDIAADMFPEVVPALGKIAARI